MIRFEGPDGQPLTALTIRCDQDDAEFLLELLREHIGDLEELAKPGAQGEIAIDIAMSEPL